MRDLRKTLSQSIEHLHDLIFDKDDVDGVPLGSDYTGVIYREGYLFKQSRTVRKYWKTRYFVLRNDGLLYYRSNLDKENAPIGVIPLTRLAVHIDSVDNKGKPKYCLRLTCRHFKTFILCCFASEERNSWLTALLTAISEDLVSRFTLRKFRDDRCSSISSTDSGVSEGLCTPCASPLATLEKKKPTSSSIARTESCDISSLFHNVDVKRRTFNVSRRPSRSLGSLAQLAELRELQTFTDGASASPRENERKRPPRKLRKWHAFSTSEFKHWRGSYIDLSCLGSS